MIATRNPAKDNVAIATAATTGFRRDGGAITEASLALDACVTALRDVGLTAGDVNGLVGANAPYMQSALGIPDLNYWSGPGIPFVASLNQAMNAIYAGACDTVLAYHSVYRSPYNSREASNDPFRRIALAGLTLPLADGFGPDTVTGAAGYAAWAGRYLHEFNASRETFGYIAVNDRTNATRNPHAVMREPITLEDYLDARMIRWPLSLLDMDVPVDGADAFVITTAERAKDLPFKPVLVHACTQGMVAPNEEDQIPGLHHHGQHVVARTLRAKSDIWIDDIDVYFPYDGFTVLTVSWIENTGWCGFGEARGFIESHWDNEQGRILIKGRVPVNPHGGALSEGGTQGSGHVREAVLQLQGRAAERQVPGASKALITTGGFFSNAQGAVLRTE